MRRPRRTGANWHRRYRRSRGGYDWYDLAMLQAAVPVFAELCREHIALEECVVYPAAQNLLRHAKD